MFERFTESAREIVVLAQVEARSLRHNYIGTEHLLLGLLSQRDGRAAQILGRLGVEREQVRAGVTEVIGLGSVEEPDAEALDAIGIDLNEVRRRVEESFGPGALERAREARAVGLRRRSRRRLWSRRRCDGPGLGYGHIPFTPRAKKVLELSLAEARSLGHRSLEGEHILLALLREAEGIGALLLHKLGVDYERARQELDRPPG